jgi:hypothetical protein
MIEQYNNFLSQDEWDYVFDKTVEGKTWSFMGRSNENGNPFWFMNLINDEFFSNKLFTKIKNVTKKDFDLLRVYANGQTFGLDGQFHIDTKKGEEKNKYFTFLYYPCKSWDASWGGKTIIVDEENSLNFQYPSPNNAIMFDSTNLHYGEGPARLFYGLRVTVAFKMKIRD